MGLIVSFVFFLVLPAVIAYVLAGVLPNLFPRASYRARTLAAASGAGCLPMILPAAVLLLGPSYKTYSSTVLVPLAGVLFLTLLLAVVIGLPVAIFARRGKEAPQDHSRTFD